jgi:N-formylglutamate amidohydrolase
MLPALAYAQTNSGAARLLTSQMGMLPIIITAPHGGRQEIPGVPVRRGAGVPQFTTERDSNTSELAEMLATSVGQRLGARPFLVVAHFERKYVDANRPAAAAYESAEAKPYYDAYHRAVSDASEQIRRQWGGGLLLDIHGQGAVVDTIFRGTNNGKSIATLRQRFGADAVSGPKSILAQMTLKGYKIEPVGNGDDREHRYTGGYTTQTYGSHRGTRIDAMQLEFGTDLRARRNLDRTANDLAHAIEIFAREFLPLAKRIEANTPSVAP